MKKLWASAAHLYPLNVPPDTIIEVRLASEVEAALDSFAIAQGAAADALAEKDAEIASLQRVISDREARIGIVTEQLAAASEELRDYKDAVESALFPCADEEHCTCQPLLTGEVLRLKAAFDSACATIDIRDEQLAAARAEVERLKEALDGMLHQFAYPVPGPKLTTGGLSTLELAFEVMGWDDPQPTPERKCDEPGCTEHSTCGWPAKGGPYRRTCYDHMEKQP